MYIYVYIHMHIMYVYIYIYICLNNCCMCLLRGGGARERPGALLHGLRAAAGDDHLLGAYFVTLCY